MGTGLDHWASKGGELRLSDCSLWPWASSSRSALDARLCFTTCSFCKSKLLEFLLTEVKCMCAKAHPTYRNAFPSGVTSKSKCLSFTVFLPFVQGCHCPTPQRNRIVPNRPGMYFLKKVPHLNNECSWLQSTQLNRENFDDDSRAKTLLRKVCCHFCLDISQL